MKESWPEPHHPELKKHFQKIKEAIESPPDEDPVINKKRLQSFYEAYNALLASPPYAKLADGDLGRAFIERLAVVMVEEVEGIEAYAAFDEKISGSEKAPENLKGMADQLRDRLTDPKYLKRDHFWEKRMWEFFSAKGPYESVRSEFTGVHFDSVLQGNMLSKAWDFGDSEIYAILGPGTFDPILQVYMNAKNRGILLHHNLQNKAKSGERSRVNLYHDMNALGHENLHVSSSSMDGLVGSVTFGL